MAILNDYQQLIREHFDISDAKTRKTIVALEDAEQTQLLAALSSALYDKIMEKVDDIDFGTIPRSRGDITKVEGFENTMECLNIIRRMVMEYRENPEIVNTVLTAVENIRSRKTLFMKSYAMNASFPIMLYNLIVLSIEQSVSFLIATCIQYIKDPASQSLNAALDKVAYNNTKDNLLYQQLYDFNKACSQKDFDDTLYNMLKNAKFNESFGEFEDTGAGVNSIVINVGKTSIGTKPEKSYEEKEGCEKDKSEAPTPVCPEYRNAPYDCEPEEKPSLMNVGFDDFEEEPERMPQDYEPQAINGSGEIPMEEPLKEGIGKVAWGFAKDAFNELDPTGKALTIGASAIVLSAIALKSIRFILKSLIPIIRNCTYFLISSKVKLSDALAVQAQLIEANAYKLQYSTNSDLDDEKKTKVVEKQLKIAEKLKKWSNTFAIDSNKAKKEANKLVQDDSKQKKIDDLKDKLPPDITSKDGGLFAY